MDEGRHSVPVKKRSHIPVVLGFGLVQPQISCALHALEVTCRVTQVGDGGSKSKGGEELPCDAVALFGYLE